ncbi:hypothetical protein FisN_19Lh178 [Fistulifera solaris]|uniref:Uncharacterized protein n=1 Tax=Fistulifera solaris TaxID=1519565 RepID=A0A1Z5J6Y4_FISSO|nr:hypothetical protein FisN_19Lh178 [Fistulifera solaris]|eukprot:GAX09709.1 hypothetical protein FisN_19Lh178 [Fistulifera solaris]
MQYWRLLVTAFFIGQQPRPTRSFATYLLSRSNCWTDLSTDEVIMNHRVVSHEESDDPMMHIQLVGGPLPAGTTFPTKVALQVLTENPSTNRDYQYVMEVNGTGAAFVGGSCDMDRRIAGRAKDIVELTLKDARASVTVWAGWAAGHEAVRLTPKFIIDPPAGEQPNLEKEWYEALMQSCASVDWTSIDTLASRPVVHSETAELYMDGTVELPRVALRNVDFSTLVIHATAGATVGTTSCPHMALVSASDEWPELSLDEERTIYISGIYALASDPTTLYRTKALELEWTAENDTETDIEHHKEEEEEGEVTKARKEAKDARIHDQEKINKRVESHAKQIQRDREAVKKRGESWKASTGKETRTKPRATPDQPFDHVYVPNSDETDSVVFDVGPHYYIAMAILIGAGVVATQLCLFTSRRDKGRRDL